MARRPQTYQVGKYLAIRNLATSSDQLYRLYLAKGKEQRSLYWLVVAAGQAPERTFDLGAPLKEQYIYKGYRCLVYPINGTHAAHIQAEFPTIDWAFIGWRWYEAAANVGYYHRQKQLYQQDVVDAFRLENVAFNADGTAFLSRLTRMGGTSFDPPEKAEGKLYRASDTYSLGVSLLYMLGSPQPEQFFQRSMMGGFTDDPQHALAARTLKQQPALATVLSKATHPQPTERYQSGTEFAQALGSVLPLEARDPDPTRKRGWLGWEAAAAAVLIALIALTLYARQNNPEVFAFLESASPNGIIDALDVNLNNTEACVQADISPNAASGEARDIALDLTVKVDGAIVVNTTRNVPVERTLADMDECLINIPLDKDFGFIEVVATTADDRAVDRAFFDRRADAGNVSDQPEQIIGLQIATDEYPDINVYFGLVDANRKPARLSQITDMQVQQDGVTVENFELEPAIYGSPPTLTLLVDESGSMGGGALVAAQAAARAFITQLDNQETVAVYGFADQVRLHQPVTRNYDDAIDAVNRLTAPNLAPTALYAAIVQVSNDQAARGGRQAVILLSDGANTVDGVTNEQALATARQSGIPFFTIGLLSPEFDGGAAAEVAQETSGLYLEAPAQEDLLGLYDQLKVQMDNQYHLSFRSLTPNVRQGFVTLRVELTDGQVIEAQREYLVR